MAVAESVETNEVEGVDFLLTKSSMVGRARRGWSLMSGGGVMAANGNSFSQSFWGYHSVVAKAKYGQGQGLKDTVA